MKNVGFHGGHTVYEAGTSTDALAFFECIRAYTPQKEAKRFDILNDRLYRRYLRLDELDEAVAAIEQMKGILASVRSSEVHWSDLSITRPHTKLNLDGKTVDEVFVKWFDSLFKAIGSAKSFYEEFEIYQAVKTVISDMPYFMEDKKRPLDQYDGLKGKPFWLR